MNWWLVVLADIAGCFAAGFLRVALWDLRRWRQRRAEVGRGSGAGS